MADVNSTPNKIPANVLRNLASWAPSAVSLLADFGPEYFNPLVGQTPAETCGRISDVMAFLHNSVESGVNTAETSRGLALIVQTVWSAAQYEGNRSTDMEVSHG